MRSSQGLTLVAIVALFGVGLFVLTGRLQDDPEDSRSEELVSEARIDVAPTSGAPPSAPDTGSSSRVLSSGGTGLVVIVVGPGGLPVPGARIRARGPDGELPETSLRADWDGIAAGSWTLEVEAEGYLATSVEEEVREGEKREVFVELYREVEVHGVLKSVFGDPLPNQGVWLLRGERPHPDGSKKAEKRSSARTATDGSFVLANGRAGTFRLSVGEVGSADFISPPFQLPAGPPRECVVVSPRGVRLAIQLIGAPSREADGETALRVVLLSSKQPLDDSGQLRPKDVIVDLRNLPVPGSGAIELFDLRSDRAYALALARRNVRTLPSRPFQLEEGLLTQVDAVFPDLLQPKRKAQEGTPPPEPAALEIAVRALPAAGGERPGLTWK